jgi:hypothetical protein
MLKFPTVFHAFKSTLYFVCSSFVRIRSIICFIIYNTNTFVCIVSFEHFRLTMCMFFVLFEWVQLERKLFLNYRGMSTVMILGLDKERGKTSWYKNFFLCGHYFFTLCVYYILRSLKTVIKDVQF